MTAVAITIACVLAVIAGLTWIVTTKTKYLPVLFTTDVRFHTQLPNQINMALWLWGAIVLAALFARRRTIVVDGDFARLHAKLLGGGHR